jgi:hypothetical protein
MMVVVHMNVQAAAVAMHDSMSVRLGPMLLVAVVVDRHIQSRRQDGEDEDCGDHWTVPVHAANCTHFEAGGSDGPKDFHYTFLRVHASICIHRRTVASDLAGVPNLTSYPSSACPWPSCSEASNSASLDGSAPA